MYPTTTASTKWTDSGIICRKGDGHSNFRCQLGVPCWEGQGQYPEAIDGNLLFTTTLTVGRRMFTHFSHFLGPTNILRYHIDRHPGSLQRPDHRCSKETRLPCELNLSYHTPIDANRTMQLLPLLADSMTYVQKLGKAQSMEFNLDYSTTNKDTTHLNAYVPFILPFFSNTSLKIVQPWKYLLRPNCRRRGQKDCALARREYCSKCNFISEDCCRHSLDTLYKFLSRRAAIPDDFGHISDDRHCRI